MILKLKLILCLLLLSSLGRAEISTGWFKSVPDQKDMSGQFKNFHNSDRITQWGGSCHIFSAVYLVEAACKRITGKEDTISPYYYYNRHMSEQLNDILYYDIEKPSEGLNTVIDGGYPEKTIDRIIKNPICLSTNTKNDRVLFDDFGELAAKIEAEFGDVVKKCTYPGAKNYKAITFEDYAALSPEDKKIEGNKRKVRAAEESIQEYNSLNFVAKGFARKTYQEAQTNKKQALGELKKMKVSAKIEAKKQICELLNEQMVCYLGDQAAPSKKGGLSRRTPSENEDIKACLSKNLKYKKEKFTVKRGLELLSQDKPFLCLGKYQQNRLNGMHVAAVVGYKKDLSKVDGVDWRLNDSNLSSPDWGWDMSKNCQDIIYIDI